MSGRMEESGPGKMPLLFIGHGSPLNILLDNGFTRSLKKIAGELPTPRAIMVISAHWLTRGTLAGCAIHPEQIYDFYGFPEELYRVSYRPPGAPRIARRLTESGGPVRIDCSARGLDHASWAVLRHMYPKADIPVFEVSLDTERPEDFHFELARQFSFLRREGVLLIGSGNVVHNLGRIDFENIDAAYDWALEADGRIKRWLLEKNQRALTEFPSSGRIGSLAMPTNDHYPPMLYAAGMREDDETIEFFHEGIQNGSISMRSFRIG
jgi:4,5-DOPA dioxygenase extradiol